MLNMGEDTGTRQKVIIIKSIIKEKIMKLSWRDMVTTAFMLAGGAIVYAKFYEYSWAVIGSWRSAVAVIAAAGLGMFLFSRFDFSNFSILNIVEMLVGFLAIGAALAGMLVTSELAFYSLAVALGVLWLLDTARHLRHSMIDEGTTSYHHHVPAH